MNNEELSQVYDTPTLSEEAKSQGIEVMDSNTDQIAIDEDGVDPLLNNEEGEHSEDNNSNEDTGNDSDSRVKANTEGALQEEVDKHSKALGAIKEDLKNRGVDFNAAAREYEYTGTLSQETLDNLNKAGYSPEVVEAFIEGRRAIEEKFTNAVYDSVGGTKEYQKIISWASENLSNKTISAFNRAIDNNNISAITLMLEGMRAKMVAKMGTANRSIHGGTSAPKSSIKGFTSKNDVIKAMSDPRYGRDAAYTQMVERQMWATEMN